MAVAKSVAAAKPVAKPVAAVKPLVLVKPVPPARQAVVQPRHPVVQP